MKHGAPTGIEAEPEDVCVFSGVHEQAPEDVRRTLLYHREQFVHYKPLEDSEHSEGILQELAQAGYIDVYDDISKSEAVIGHWPVVVSKMALIITTNRRCPQTLS